MANEMTVKRGLLYEDIDFESVENKILIKESEGAQIKKYYIKGPFLESDMKNKNGRTYPKAILKREVDRVIESYLKTNRLIGELGHPDNLEINLDRVSHKIIELNEDGHCFTGKALIMDTPFGKIAKEFINEGIKLGVSSRGAGSLKNDIVQNDYSLKTVDIVSEPSAPAALVDGILECKTEWIIENNILTEKEIETLHTNLDTYTREDYSTAVMKVFGDFFELLKKGKR